MKSLDGGTWVDLFGAVFIARLIGPLFHMPPMNGSEAGIWMATITSFAYSNKGGPKDGAA